MRGRSSRKTGPPPFERLPRELIRYVGSLLPTSSAAALSVTSKSFLFVLGTQYLEQLRGAKCDIQELQRLLFLISKDLPDYYSCSDCLCLHLRDVVKPKMSAMSRLRRTLKYLLRLPLPPKQPQPSCKLGIPTYRGIGGLCTSVDAAAEAYLFAQHGLNFQRLNKLMLRKVVGLPTAHALNNLTVLGIEDELQTEAVISFRFRIIGNELLMRSEYQLRAVRNWTTPLPSLYLCPHLVSGPQVGHAHLNRKLRCAFNHQGSQSELLSCVNCSTLISCDFRPTELQFSVTPDKFSGPILVITRWLNLGNLTSPYEPKWRSHLSHRNLDWSNGTGAPCPLVTWTPGSIKAMWES